MPFDGDLLSSLGFRVSYDFWAYIQKSYDEYVMATKSELSAVEFRQLAFELGVEKNQQKVTEGAVRIANEHIRPRFKSIAVSLRNIELDRKFQKIRYDVAGRVVEPITAAVVFIYDGVEELLTLSQAAAQGNKNSSPGGRSKKLATEGDDMTASGKNNPPSDRPGVLIEVDIMPREEARETFRYNSPPPPKGREITNEDWKSSMQRLLGNVGGTSSRTEKDEPYPPKGRAMTSKGWNLSIQSALATLDEMIAKP